MHRGHLKSGETINLEKLGKDLNVSATHALVRTDDMEVIRMVIPRGKTVNEHSVDGEITLQCLKGKVQFKVDGTDQNLSEDDWLYLDKKVPHELTAEEDTILLLTILFNN